MGGEVSLVLVILSIALLALLGLAYWFSRTPRLGSSKAHLDLLAIALFVPLVIMFFWQSIFLPNIWLPKGGGDLSSSSYPMYQFAADTLRQGTIPLWSPYVYAGSPFAADLEVSLFYPPMLLADFLANPFNYKTVESLIILHYLIATTAMYLYARNLGLRRPPAFVAGTIFGFGGFMVARLGHSNILFATVWFPLTLLFFHRALKYAGGRAAGGELSSAAAPKAGEGTARSGFSPHRWINSGITNAVLAGAFYGMTILGGHPQMPLYFALFLALYWLWAIVAGAEVRPGRDVELRRRALIWVGSLRYVLLVPIVGFGISAVQLLPTLELAGLSVRANISYAQAAEFALEPRGLITMLVPHFFGNNFAGYWGLTWSLTEVYAYAGIVTLLLAGISLVIRRRGSKWLTFYALVAVFFVLVSMGEKSIIHGWMYAFVPMFSKVRSAGRSLLFVDISLAILAAHGLESFARLTVGPRLRLMRSVAKRMVQVSAVALVVATPSFALAVVATRGDSPQLFQETLIAVRSYGWSALFLVLGLGVIWAGITWSRWRHAASLALIVLVAADLVVSNGSLQPTDEDVTSGFARSDIIDFLLEHESNQRVDAETGIVDVWQPNLPLIYRFSDVMGLDKPLFYADYREFWQNMGGRSTPAYDLLGVRYVIARKGVTLDWSKFRLAKQGSGVLDVYENPAPFPRALVVPAAESVPLEQTMDRLKSSDFDPKKVVLINSAGHVSEATDDGSGGTNLAGEVVSLSYPTVNEVRVSTNASNHAYLLLNDVWYPGWKAYVDGQEKEVMRADFIFRAVELPQGSHEVRFVFDPWTWKVGLVISIFSWLFLLGTLGLRAIGVRSRRLAD